MPSNADQVWLEFTAVLETLAPDVRAAFLLHEVFEASYDDIALLIGLSAQTCRDHVEYAREHAIPRMPPLGDDKEAPPK